MQRDEARQLVVAVHHRQEGDLARVLHRAHRVHSLLGNQDGRGRRVHHLRDWHLQHVRALRLQRAAQVAVCEGAQQVVLRVQDQHAAAALAGQLNQCINHFHLGRDHREQVASDHDIVNRQHEALADAARGVVHRILVLGEVARQHEGDGHGVTKEHLDGGGGDGRQVEGAQLALQRQVDRHVGSGLQLVTLHGGHADQGGALGARVGHKAQQLLGASRLGEHHQQVAGADDANIAVQSVGGR
mmetsp:Transcript_12664/g.31966  ORF Transcript_12664/g.31966 Transcript_12664/m.31966 type:complete len:243 (+) Transcript_12664:220-948(+)